MIDVGEKLGGRYFIIHALPVVEVGAPFEVRDPQSRVVTAQFLHADPVTPELLERMRREAQAVPAGPHLLRPDEVVASTRSLPAAIYQRPVPQRLREQLQVLAAQGPRPEALVSIVRWFAAVADALARAHQSRVVHGAIHLDMLVVETQNHAQRAVLTGFGAAVARSTERPAPRDDVIALVLTLHEALQLSRQSFKDGAQTRWDILRNCARGGDHPAFASARALAACLTELATLQEPVRRPRSIPPPRSAPPSRPPPPEEVPPPPAPVASPPPHRRPRVLAGAAAVLALAAVGAALAFRSAPDARPQSVTLRRAAPESCGDEPVATAAAIEFPAPVDDLDLLCSHDHLSLTVLARAGHTLLAAARQSRRGGRLEWGPVPLDDGVRAAGGAVVNPDGAWVAWRNDTGLPFGLARIDRNPRAATLAMPAWESAPFRDAFLLKVHATAAFLASTLDTPTGPVATVVELALAPGPGERSIAVYRIADATVVAAVPGDPSVLLLDTRDARGHVLHTVSVPLASLSFLATPLDGGFLALPGTALARSPEHVLPGDPVSFVPRGEGRTFLATARESVTLLDLPAHGDPTARVLTPHGLGEDLVGSPDHTRIVQLAAPARALRYFPNDGTESRGRQVVLPSLRRTRLAWCEPELWIAFTPATAPARVSVLPVPCVSR